MLFKITTNPAPPNPKVSDTEFKAFYPAVNANMEWCTLEPYIEQAEDLFIKPAISDAFYDVLDTEYTATGTIADPEQATTFRLLRVALANYVMFLAMPDLAMRLGDGGTMENNSGDTMPVRQWVFKETRWNAYRKAYRFLDSALVYMEDQVAADNADFATFEASDAYTVSRRYLIPDAATFQRYYNINRSRLTFVALRPYIEKAQELYVRPLLCDLYDEILTQYAAGTLTAANNTLLEHIRRYLAEATLTEAFPDLNFVNDGQGWITIADPDAATIAGDQLSQMQQNQLTRAETNAASFRLAIENHIYTNLDDYPTYKASSCNEIEDTENNTANPETDPEAGAFII